MTIADSEFAVSTSFTAELEKLYVSLPSLRFRASLIPTGTESVAIKVDLVVKK